MLKIYTDTDTDMTPELAASYGYKLISMPYSVDAKTIYPYEDFETFDGHAFYDMLRGGVLPTTSAISKERYIAYFEEDFKAGNEILYVHFSRAMTNTFDVMDQAGKSLDEVLEWARTEVEHFAMYFFADDLKFFRRSGRVSGLAATMGTLIGLRPIIHMSAEGKMVSLGTVKGRFKAMERLVDTVAEIGDDIQQYRICIGHTDAPEIAAEIGKMMTERFGPLDIEYVYVNPTAGSHCGPNGVGVAFHSKHR